MVTVELSAPDPAQGQLVVLARLPDGRSAQYTAYVELRPGSWLATQSWRVALPVLVTAAGVILLARSARRPARIGDHADPDRQATLGIGEAVPLDTFMPGAAGALRRGWLRYHILADGQPVSVSGRVIPAGTRGRYRLGEDVRVGDRTFALFRIDATPPAVSADDFSFGQRNGRAQGGLR